MTCDFRDAIYTMEVQKVGVVVYKINATCGNLYSGKLVLLITQGYPTTTCGTLPSLERNVEILFVSNYPDIVTYCELL